MVRIRPREETFRPPPDYEKHSKYITISMHYGGKLIEDDGVKYVGGFITKVDYVDYTTISMGDLHDFADSLSLSKEPRQFSVQPDGKVFYLLTKDQQIMNLCIRNLEVKEVDVYMKCDVPDCPVGIERVNGIHTSQHDWDDCIVSDYETSGDEDEGHEVNEDDEPPINDGGQEEDANHSDIELEEEAIVWGSDDDMESELESDDEKLMPEKVRSRKSRVCGKKLDEFYPEFYLGQEYGMREQLRKAVHTNAVNNLRNVTITRNNKERLYAKCNGSGCAWKLRAVIVKGELTFRIVYLNAKHTCLETVNVTNVKSSFLARKYLGLFKSDPNRSTMGFMLDAQKDLGINITFIQAYRAKKLAIRMLEGDPNEQFLKMWDYVDELKRTNPGSTVIMGTDPGGEGKFTNFYCCFHAVKQGFLAGCRPIIGVDGTGLNGPHGGILLAAQTENPNPSTQTENPIQPTPQHATTQTGHANPNPSTQTENPNPLTQTGHANSNPSTQTEIPNPPTQTEEPIQSPPHNENHENHEDNFVDPFGGFLFETHAYDPISYGEFEVAEIIEASQPITNNKGKDNLMTRMPSTKTNTQFKRPRKSGSDLFYSPSMFKQMAGTSHEENSIPQAETSRDQPPTQTPPPMYNQLLQSQGNTQPSKFVTSSSQPANNEDLPQNVLVKKPRQKLVPQLRKPSSRIAKRKKQISTQ